jgi:phosphoheptose isomerase
MAAATVITNTTLALNTFAALPATAAVEATNGALVTAGADHKMLLIAENASADTAKTVTVKAGNGIQGLSDLALSIPAASTKCVVIESMKFVNTSGTNKGKILITGTDANIKIACVLVP